MRLQQLIKELTKIEQTNGNILVEYEEYNPKDLDAIYWPISEVTLSFNKKEVILR